MRILPIKLVNDNYSELKEPIWFQRRITGYIAKSHILNHVPLSGRSSIQCPEKDTTMPPRTSVASDFIEVNAASQNYAPHQEIFCLTKMR